MKVTEKDREIEVQPCILCDEVEQLEMIWKQRGNGYIECGCCGLKGPKAEGIIGATREWNSLHGRVAAAYARGLEDAAKVLPTLPRYEVGGECDGDSGHCYAEMELDDSGRYVGIDDAQAAIRKLREDK